MPRNGTGTYSLPAGLPYVPGTVISSTVANGLNNDLATALTTSIASTGVTTPTANLPMGGFRHTGVGNAQSLTQYASATDVQNGSITVLSSVTGGDTIAAVGPLAVAAYAPGQRFQFIAAGSNTGPVTLNINAIGAKAITKQGTVPLAVADISIGQAVDVFYDGTQFQMIGARSATSTVVVMQSFTASGTYTPTTGMQYAIVHLVGGGGGGAVVASGSQGGGGGGAGEYATAVLSAATVGASQTITIGTAAAAGANGTGTAIGSIISAAGGSTGAAAVGGLGGTGGIGSGFRTKGGQGEDGLGPFTGPALMGGHGGASYFGGGGRGGFGNLDSGQAGSAYGSGGGGNGFTGGSYGGSGAGAVGCIVIYEYL